MGKLFANLVIGGCVLLGFYVLFVAGFFVWSANQPMQVAEAQAVAPGITFSELLVDRYARWKERGEHLYSSGQAKTAFVCQGSNGLIFYPAVISANLSVTIAHFNPAAEAGLREGWNGVFPPTEVLAGPLHKAWWWEIENYAWNFWVYPAGSRSPDLNDCHVDHVGYPTRPAGSQ